MDILSHAYLGPLVPNIVWQRMVLSIIVNVGYADKFDSQEEANAFVMQAQNFLICLEMLFSAVAHCFVFSPDEWAEGYREREEKRRQSTTRGDRVALGDSVALGDFIHDVKVVMASKKRRKRRKKVSSTDGGLDISSPSPSSTDMDESDHLELAVSTSDDGGDDNFRRIDGPLSTPEHNQPPTRRRLDTGGSIDSDGDEIDQSLTRIEQFIEGHTPKQQSLDKNEVV